MKFSQLFNKTLKENPNDAELISHKLLVRAGFIKKLASGIYIYLPMGLKVLKKIENIVREELNNANCQELLMPIFQPKELWVESQRYDNYGPDLMKIKDRHENEFILGPTNEEVITSIVRNMINSYKELPFNVYHIQTKFRDEIRPRFGLLRGREFLMKDGYSFHISEESLKEEYDKMYDVYSKIFKRLNLNFRPVEADTGNIGGNKTHEFMALASSGEDEILYCNHCNYAANIERATSNFNANEVSDLEKKLEKVETKETSSIEDISKLLNIDKKNICKSLLYKTDTNYYMCLIRGDYDINEVKLKRHLNTENIELLNDSDFEKFNLKKGYVGPVGIDDSKIKILADESIKDLKNFVTGANEINYHFLNSNYNRDFVIKEFIDIIKSKENDICKCKNGKLIKRRGIEVGQIFELGDKYSKAMNCKVLNINGKEVTLKMGCYGIGVSRTLAAIVEQSHDDFGMLWPMNLAPFIVNVIPVKINDDSQMSAALKIYNNLLKQGVDVILDDRKNGLGFKLKDSDLIGIPIKVIVGNKILENKVEIKLRTDKNSELIDFESVQDKIMSLI